MNSFERATIGNSAQESRALTAILWAWAIAGTLDISDALIFYHFRGVSATRLLQNIARALIGPRAFDGGVATAALGLGLHYLIALGATVVFYLLSRKIVFMTRLPWIAGPLYGICVYVFMNYFVLRLAGMAHPKLALTSVFVNAVLALMICIGLTIALVVSRISPR
jgi:hypothetical protein